MRKINLNELKKMDENPRKISKKDLEMLVNSICQYSKNIKKKKEGYNLIDPIIVNSYNNNIIAGHQRLLALEKLGQAWIYEDDIRFVEIKEKNVEKSLNLALNKISGEWDIEKLDCWINELYIDNYDMKLTGFSEDELYDFLDFDIIEDDSFDLKQAKKRELNLIKFEFGCLKGYINREVYELIYKKIKVFLDKYNLLETALKKIFDEVKNG